jgi:apolipoprotein D and lipocalin family protein
MAVLWGLLLTGCIGLPRGLEPVSGFDPDLFLGKWYEIARLDHSFERGLEHVTAEYSLRPDGDIAVVNRGYDGARGAWREVRGRARFIGERTVGSLKVSFFEPFWGGYHIIALDAVGYRYAMVSGPSRSYLWILARDMTLPAEVFTDLVAKAQEWGFESSSLIRVKQGEAPGGR